MLVLLLKNSPELMLDYCQAGSIVVLLQNGIYSAQHLRELQPKLKIYALANDWLAAGMPEISAIELISHEQWVALCATHKPVISLQ